jgi:uncharacterized protein YkwD
MVLCKLPIARIWPLALRMLMAASLAISLLGVPPAVAQQTAAPTRGQPSELDTRRAQYEGYAQALRSAEMNCDKASADHALANLRVLSGIVEAQEKAAQQDLIRTLRAKGASEEDAVAKVAGDRTNNTVLGGWANLSREINGAIAGATAYDWSHCGPHDYKGLPLTPEGMGGEIEGFKDDLEAAWRKCDRALFSYRMMVLKHRQSEAADVLKQLTNKTMRAKWQALADRIDAIISFYSGVSWDHCKDHNHTVQVEPPSHSAPSQPAPQSVPAQPACPSGSQVAAPSSSQALNQAVLDEINRARTQPGEYAKSLIEFRSHIRGGVIYEPGQPPLAATPRFSAALDGAIAFLQKQAPLPALKLDPRLSQSAGAFVADQGPKGGLGHVNSDGATIMKRIQTQCLWAGINAEVIAYGHKTAAGAVRDLVIDWGADSTPHRDDLYSPSLEFAGVASGGHATRGEMIVIDMVGSVLKR